MTENLKEICRDLITGSRETIFPFFFYGDWDNVGKSLKLIAIGASRCQKQPVYQTNGYMYMENRFFRLIDGIPDETKNEVPQSGLVVFDSLQRLEGEEDAIRRFERLVETLCDHGGQIVLGASCPPDEMSFLSDHVRERIGDGLAFSVEGEEIRSPVWELMQMGLWPEKGRFSSLYNDKYLKLFPAEPTADLNAEQMSALEEMKRIVGRLTDLYRGLFMQRVQEIIRRPGIYCNPVPKDWSAETTASAICYVFWNRFNCDEEGYEVAFARSGQLGQYLRYLKERDK